MKKHTNDFKNEIKKFGRQIDSKITYTINNEEIELGAEQLNSITPHYEGSILKSAMRQLDIDSNVEISEGTIINYQFGVKTRSGKNICPTSIDDWESGEYAYADGTKKTSASRIRVKQLIKVNPNTTYYFNTFASNTNYKFVLRAYNSTGTFIRSIGTINNGSAMTTSSNDYYIGITMYNSASSSINFNTYKDLFASGDIKPFICLNSESDKSYEAYGEYDYVNFGNYVVYKVEKQEDTYSYKITCYDKMLYSMIPYEALSITYPITIRSYLSAICTRLGLTFKNASDTFANYNKEIASELYLDSEGNSLDYTFRDVLDEIAGATGSTICINEDDDELEVRYIKYAVGKNLFDKDNANVLNAYFNNVSGYNKITNNNNTRLIYIECKPNKTYTISKMASARFFVGYTNELPSTNVVVNGIIGGTTGETSYTITTGPNAKYLCSFLYHASYDTTITLQQILDSVQIEEGSSSSPYEPYGDTIDEEYLKDVNVKFGEKYGKVNSIVLSRSAESDNIYIRDEESVTANGLCEIKIKDNQILNGNNRDEFLQGLLDALDGLEYYINDFTSTGIVYYNLCDRYNVKIGDNTYSCVMFNDEIDITQGLQEQIYTEMPEESETDYKKADKTDRKIREAYIIVDKQNGEINAVVQDVNTLSQRVDSQGNQIDALGTRITQNVNSITASVTAIQDELTNGVSKVKTTSVTIDNSGLNVSTDTSKISTQMTNNAFEIKDSGNNTLAFFGYDETEGISKSVMDNLTVTNYFVAGVHRIEDYPENGEDRTGWFYIGG